MLWRTYGKDILIAGIFKLLWSVFVILGGGSGPASSSRAQEGGAAFREAGPAMQKIMGARPGKSRVQNRAPDIRWPPLPHAAPLPAPAAYYFTRSILLCIRTLEGKDSSVYDTEWKGWVLTAFFFVDAWLLGTRRRTQPCGSLTSHHLPAHAPGCLGCSTPRPTVARPACEC